MDADDTETDLHAQGATYKEVAEAASQQDFATCSNSEEMLLFHCSSYSKGPRNVGLANCQTELLQHLKAEDEQHLRGCALSSQHYLRSA